MNIEFWMALNAIEKYIKQTKREKKVRSSGSEIE